MCALFTFAACDGAEEGGGDELAADDTGTGTGTGTDTDTGGSEAGTETGAEAYLCDTTPPPNHLSSLQRFDAGCPEPEYCKPQLLFGEDCVVRVSGEFEDHMRLTEQGLEAREVVLEVATTTAEVYSCADENGFCDTYVATVGVGDTANEYEWAYFNGSDIPIASIVGFFGEINNAGWLCKESALVELPEKCAP